LLAVLNRGVVRDVELELILTEIRRMVLMNDSAQFLEDVKLSKFLPALCQQCVNNEFVFDVSEPEDRVLNLLESNILKSIHTGKSYPDSFPTYCLYRSPNQLALVRQLLPFTSNYNHSIIEDVVKPDLKRIGVELVISKEIATLSELSARSTSVANQYEENPYPRWHGIAPVYAGAEVEILIERLGEIAEPLRNKFLNILIAGCGTGQSAIQSGIGFGPSARITAVDLSRASLVYAVRMARKLGVSNIEFFQADILNLQKIDLRFDILECTGVLHHMDDPIGGWRTLVELLKPDGLMLIALYRELGRGDIARARDEIEKSKRTSSPSGNRNMRQYVIRNRDKDWCERLIKSPDFFTMSGCRDLMFHVQERNYTIPQIMECLNELNLTVCSFELPPQLLSRFADQHGSVDWKSPNFLELWWEFEQNDPAAFPRMYQFWCKRN